jgi:hypothetical protein
MVGAALCAAAVFGSVVAPSLAWRGPGVPDIRDVLHANGIGPVGFGESPAWVLPRLDALLKHRPSEPYHAIGACYVDHAIGWPGLAVFFHETRFVGYSYRPANGVRRVPILATAKGLRVGETLTMGRELYGQSFHSSASNGGRWWASTPRGLVEGLTAGWPGGPKGSVATIAAGDVGCPAMSP